MANKPTKEEKTFYCKRTDLHDRYVWVDTEYVYDDDVAIANCPICGQPTQEVPRYYTRMYKMWQHATGPKTPEGKARSRLNNWKHGLRSSAATLLAPAIPGKFLECNGCEYRKQCEDEHWKYCPVNLEPVVKFIKAYMEGKVTDLRELAAFSQGHVFSLVRMMFQDVYKRGVVIEKVKKAIGKRGEEILSEDLQANPVLNRIPEFLALLGFTAEQQMMTPKTEQEDENMKGFLQAEKEKSEKLDEYLKKQSKAVEELKLKIQKAALQRQADEALKRHQMQVERENADEEEST